jgi:pimeloyl-ACP methyl ester carboxylesterase
VSVALLHGFAGTPAVWDDVPFAGTPLALPGHGAPMQGTWDACVAALGTHELVVGYSLGARVALAMVARGQCARAILIGVNPGIVEDRAARRASDAAWARLLRERGTAAFAEAWTAQPLFATQARVDPARLATRRAQRLALDPEQLAQSLEVMGLAEMPDYRDAIRDPRVRLVAGADDAKYVAIARDLGLPVTLIAGSGHDPTLEQPQRLAAALHALAP